MPNKIVLSLSLAVKVLTELIEHVISDEPADQLAEVNTLTYMTSSKIHWASPMAGAIPDKDRNSD